MEQSFSLRPQFTDCPKQQAANNVCGLQKWLNHICDELQLLFWLLCRGSTVSCMTSVLQAGWLQLPHANRWMSKLAMAAWETPRVQTHTLRTLRVDFVNASASYIYIGQAGQRSVLQNRLKYDLLQHESQITHILNDAQNQSKAFWLLKLSHRFMPAWDMKQLLDAILLEENGEQKPKLCRVKLKGFYNTSVKFDVSKILKTHAVSDAHTASLL